jgi:hypothetical protein
MKRLKMMYNKDFKITDDFGTYKNENDVACIEILTGEFKGTKFNFGSISVNEESERATISFDYAIIENSKLLEDEFLKKEFEIVIEKIMNSLLETVLGAEMERNYNESRKENTSEVDQG